MEVELTTGKKIENKDLMCLNYKEILRLRSELHRRISGALLWLPMITYAFPVRCYGYL